MRRCRPSRRLLALRGMGRAPPWPPPRRPRSTRPASSRPSRRRRSRAGWRGAGRGGTAAGATATATASATATAATGSSGPRSSSRRAPSGEFTLTVTTSGSARAFVLLNGERVVGPGDLRGDVHRTRVDVGLVNEPSREARRRPLSGRGRGGEGPDPPRWGSTPPEEGPTPPRSGSTPPGRGASGDGRGFGSSPAGPTATRRVRRTSRAPLGPGGGGSRLLRGGTRPRGRRWRTVPGPRKPRPGTKPGPSGAGRPGQRGRPRPEIERVDPEGAGSPTSRAAVERRPGGFVPSPRSEPTRIGRVQHPPRRGRGPTAEVRALRRRESETKRRGGIPPAGVDPRGRR